MSFQHQKIVIAGGTSGIGLATAKRMAAGGAAVTITGRNPEKLKAAEKEGLRAVRVDSKDRVALDAFFSELGPVDHLVVAISGSKGMGEFAGLSLDILREGFAEKLWPQLETVQAALPSIVAGGSITLITAISSVLSRPGTSGLAAINGALEIMVPILAQELKTIRVNAVSPGLVDTPWWDFLPEEQKPGVFAQWTSGIPAGRVAKPEEIADVVAFLAGNAYMTGKVVACDGGLS
ncbi:MAG: SDR family oxidoreductase [Bacteroidetes bacterium]|nr:SDR family oxidoreductase [Bacteroidota bacterium]